MPEAPVDEHGHVVLRQEEVRATPGRHASLQAETEAELVQGAAERYLRGRVTHTPTLQVFALLRLHPASVGFVTTGRQLAPTSLLPFGTICGLIAEGRE
ncbi:hypothetical protein [Streptomyces milbemycinicus]|uniref:Uncharacterized protein n=1 Tax=Streptomyces milbemycinicus TaxID=476552 RepID=A0ABW8LYJ1_9ACTN